MSNVITDIIRDYFPDFEKNHRIPKYKIKVMQSIMACRTVSLGGHIKKCTNSACGRIEVWYNSCKNRSCPNCSPTYKTKWLEKQSKKLLHTGHYHVVFTIPSELNELWNKYPKVMSNILFTASNESLDMILKDTRYLGATAGKIMSLHTWGSNLSLHPHIHCLVSAGGLDPNNNWVVPKHKNYLFPVKALSILFRSNLLKKLKTEIRPSGSMAFDSNDAKEDCKAMIQTLFQKKWNVFIKEKYKRADSVLAYIANYLKGGAISPNRIIQVTDKFVRFKYKDYKNTRQGEKTKKGVMKLSINDFIQRLILHIPPPHSQIVRYFGLYSPNSIVKLNMSRRALHQEENGNPLNLEKDEEKDAEKKSFICKICKSHMNSYLYDREELEIFLDNIKSNTVLRNKLVEFL